MNTKPKQNPEFKVGHWSYNAQQDKFIWSDEVYKLFSWPPDAPLPTFAKFIAFAHPDDRQILTLAAEDLYKQRNDGYGKEVRMGKYNQPENYSWYHIIGKLDNKATISGVIIDISKRKELEAQNYQLNEKIITVAKQAWLAEVAVSVIHNIGNILNSATTSASILINNLNNSNLYKITEVISLLKQNSDSTNKFLTENPKGNKIPKYLIALENNITLETENLEQELGNINTCLEHIKSIISSQESISGLCNLREKVLLSNLIESTLKFFGTNIDNHNIQINKNYLDDYLVMVDYSKLLQIFTNLIKNSIDSLLQQNPDNKTITITIKKTSEQLIIITCEDNGIGIAPDDLIRLFNFGFTNKPDGHGFGLYNSIQKATELGGNLTATSPGIGHGATFTLCLPTTLIYHQP
jgi:signal transduction histidine kinase